MANLSLQGTSRKRLAPELSRGPLRELSCAPVDTTSLLLGLSRPGSSLARGITGAKPFLVGIRVDIPIIPSYVVSATLHHPWQRSQHICMLSFQKRMFVGTSSMQRRFSRNEMQYKSWPVVGSLTTSGSTLLKSYVLVILHGLNNSPH